MGRSPNVMKPLNEHVGTHGGYVILGFQSCIEVGLGFGWRDVPDGLEETAVVEPVHPFERRVFHGLEAAPRSPAVDDLGLEQPVDRLRQRVVVAVADAAHRGLDPCFRQALGVTNGQVLRAPVAMVEQPHVLPRAAIMHRLFQGIEDEPRMRRGADTPNPARFSSLPARRQKRKLTPHRRLSLWAHTSRRSS